MLVQKSKVLKDLAISSSTSFENPLNLPFPFSMLRRLEWVYLGWFQRMPVGYPTLLETLEDLSAADFLHLTGVPMLKEARKRANAGIRRAQILSDPHAEDLTTAELQVDILRGAGVVIWGGLENVAQWVTASISSVDARFALVFFGLQRSKNIWILIMEDDQDDETYLHFACSLDATTQRVTILQHRVLPRILPIFHDSIMPVALYWRITL